MANSDYAIRGGGSFCPVAEVSGAVTPAQTVIPLVNISLVGIETRTVGMAAMMGDEIVRVTAIGTSNVTVARGCADTIPAAHADGTLIWFFEDAFGTDQRAYAATESLSVKILPFTNSGGPVPVEHSPPEGVVMNWRFARPYPPGLMRVNGSAWHASTFPIEDGVSSLILTWAHRDRITQADQLIDHNAASVGPEVGVTYKARIYNGSNVLLATYAGLTGTTWTYDFARAFIDFGLTTSEPPGTLPGRIEFCSTRDTLDSFQRYSIAFNLNRQGVFGLGGHLGEYLGGV